MPSPATSADDAPVDVFEPLDQPVVALAAGPLPGDGDPHAAAKMTVPAITRMAGTGILVVLRERCIIDNWANFYVYGCGICEQAPGGSFTLTQLFALTVQSGD